MADQILQAVPEAADADSLDHVDQYAQLKKGLAALLLISPELLQRVCDFVCDGGDPAVLLELQAASPMAGSLLGKPGRIDGFFYPPDLGRKEGARAAESLRHRHQFYAQTDVSTIDAQVLVRLGKLMQAADQGNSLERCGAPVPDWLHYLVNDALHASFSETRARATAVNRRGWNAALLARLLLAEDEAEIAGLQMVFERSAISDFHRGSALAFLREPGAPDDYMLAHAALVEQLPGLLSSSGKLLLAHGIGSSPALLDAFGAILVRLAVDSAKGVRTMAAPHLAAIPQERRIDLLQQFLLTGKTDERVQAAELLGRGLGAEQSALLEEALAKETSKPVQAALRKALVWLGAATDAGKDELPDAPLPPMPPVSMLGEGALALIKANHAALLARYRADAEKEIGENKSGKHKYTWQQDRMKRYQSLNPAWLEGAIRVLNGEGSKANAGPMKNSLLHEPIEYQGKLPALPEFGLMQMARWIVATGQNNRQFWTHAFFQQWLARQDLAAFDLRLLDRALREAGDQNDSVATACMASNWYGPTPSQMLAPELVWPLLAERRELIEQGLGLRAAARRGSVVPELGTTLELLATFPVVPAQWLPRVMELALGEGKQHRAMAQQVLGKMPDIGKSVAESLESGKQDMRMGAARWLADLGHRDSVPALYQALDKETRETVIAMLLTALEKLGEDLSPRVSPAVLHAEARKGLKGKAPVGLAWFAYDRLPACRWADGTPVDAEILRWWVVLACKLKEPGGNALLLRYLSLLDEASRAALGETMLRLFIEHDVRGASLAVATAEATARAPQQYQQYQDDARRYPEYYAEKGKLTLDQVFDEIRRGMMNEYQGSAIGEKGILALAAHAPGHVAVSLLQAYMRDHYPRRAQIEAMLDALADGYDTAVIQLLLGIARRYRTASVKEKAGLLVERIAQGKGWSQDQLGDRTIPSAGFDDAGRLDLSYGDRVFHVTLDGDMKPVLHNPDGKEIKALPEPRQDESAELAKESRQQLAVCKKELKQVIAMQTARLYEAMCAGRLWPAPEWREYLLQHPVAGRLVQTLVWISEEEGVQTLLRPGDDGSLLDAHDDEVTVGEGASLRLAHASLMTPEEVAAWQRHVKDYKVTPLFEQMAHQLPDPSLMAGSEIADREGWVGDTFGLRDAFGKLGYLRGAAEDGGFFTEYHKDFASVALRVVIEFSGSELPEELVPAALQTLAFYRLPQSWGDEPLMLPDVPPVLLAESYADYHAVARACGGHDPQWEGRMPW